MNPRYFLISGRANGRCEYCHAPEAVFNFAFQVEHILPHAEQGNDGISNLALACSACNLYKGAAIVGLDEDTQLLQSLFNPRTQQWGAHLRVNLESAEIIGLTPVGRGTVARLQMNTARQLAARQQWIQLGLFP